MALRDAAQPPDLTLTAQSGSGATPLRAHPLTWLPGLDGLRAIAVLAVLVFHGDLGVLPGGFLGVDVFFVISGFLITGLLLGEHAQTGRIDVVGFWRRRARRLLPALFFLIAAVVGFAALVVPDSVARLRVDVLAAAGYVTNWYLIFDHQSYFETIGRPSLLRHLWSLAVEEQFYLVWPVLLVVAIALVRRRGALLLTLAIAAASVAWTVAVFDPDGDPSRVYYGTDTRLFGLLIGAVLAFALAPRMPSVVAGDEVPVVPPPDPASDADAGVPDSPSPWFRWPDLVALAGLTGLVWAFFNVDEFDPLLYPWGSLVVALVAAMVIGAAVHRGGIVGPRILDVAPLRWLGRRSYGIYLWHWPIFVLTRPGLDLPLSPVADFGLRVALTVALAEVSYRLVELPVRNGGLVTVRRRFRGALRGGALARGGAVASLAAIAVVIVAVSGTVLAAAPPRPPDIVPAASFQGSAGGGPAATADAGLTGASADPSVAAAAPTTTTTAEGTAGPTLEPTGATGADGSPTASFVAAGGGAAGGPGAAGSVPSALAPAPESGYPSAAPSASESALGSPPAPASTSAGSVTGGPTDQPSTSAQPGASDGSSPAASSEAPASVGPGQTPSAVAPAPVPTPAPTPRPTPTRPRSPPPGPPAQIFAIGDSVLLGAAPELRRALGDVDVDAQIGRQMSTALAILDDRRSSGRLPDVVIVHLGNNGPLTTRQVNAMFDILASVPHIVVLTVRIPDDFAAHNNRLLVQIARERPNAILFDWHAASEGRSDLFWNDGEHLRPQGAEVYAALIANVLHDHGIATR